MSSMKHKCDGCRYEGEHQEIKFRPIKVCLRETDLIEAERAYNAKKCPYVICPKCGERSYMGKQR